MADIVTNMNEMHKKVYSKKAMPTLIPDVAMLQKDIKFSQKEKTGDKYVVGVRLAYPTGFTHAKGDGTAGAFALNEVRGGTQKKAEMDTYQILLRDQMSYEDAGKATKGERSFVDGTDFFYEGLQLSARKRLETALWYGQSGIGKIGTYSASNAGYGSQPTIAIPAADFAPQIWAGIEGCDIDVMTGATGTVRGSVRVVQVDIEARIIVLSAVVSGAVAADVIYFKGCYGNELIGVHNILNNTGSLWGINASQYSLWKANQHSITGQLSFAAVKKAITKAVNKGLYGKLKLYCNPGGWDDLQTSIEALRVTSEKDVRKVDIGAESIMYHSQNGTTEIVAHPMVKEGFAYGLFLPSWQRVGAVDIELGAPGFGGEPWFNLPTNAGVEARVYTNQGIITEAPATSFVISGIVNS